MINLLPPNDQLQLRAARTNTLLARYSVLLLVVICALALEVVGMYLFVNIGITQNEATIRENAAKTASYDSVKQQAASFSSNLTIAKSILGSRISYTDLIFALAASLPQGSTISSLSLDPTTFGTPTTLTVQTTSYNKAIDVKSALQHATINGTPLFTSVSFQSVTNAGGASTYPFTATFNITYSKAALTQ